MTERVAVELTPVQIHLLAMWGETVMEFDRDSFLDGIQPGLLARLQALEEEHPIEATSRDGA